MTWCARKCARQTPRGVLNVSRANNVVAIKVVAIKHRARLMFAKGFKTIGGQEGLVTLRRLAACWSVNVCGIRRAA
jgi:hypothetical protein